MTIDFITSQGDKLALTATAKLQARSGHDVLQMSDWYVAAQADNLDPVDELVTSLIKEHGKLLLGSEYIGGQKGRWIAVPTGVQTTGQIPCARIDHFKQFVALDLTLMYPAGASRGARRRLDLGRVSICPADTSSGIAQPGFLLNEEELSKAILTLFRFSQSE